MLNIKCYKLRGIEKDICVAEQKIAYNFACMWDTVGKKILNSDMAEVGKSDAFSDIEKSVIVSLMRDEFNKYNHDAIIVAFRQGFRKYCTKPFIATNFEQIGEIFKIPYNVI